MRVRVAEQGQALRVHGCQAAASLARQGVGAAVVLCELYAWLEPEPIFGARVPDVWPRFLAGDELEPEAPNPEYRRTHACEDTSISTCIDGASFA